MILKIISPVDQYDIIIDIDVSIFYISNDIFAKK